MDVNELFKPFVFSFPFLCIKNVNIRNVMIFLSLMGKKCSELLELQTV